MSFDGVEFFYFLPAVFALYWAISALVPQAHRATFQNLVLLVAGYAFYLTWTPSLVWVIALATVVDYTVGVLMDRHRGEGTEADTRRLRALLMVSVVYNVGQLCWFKYTGFFAEAANDALVSMGFEGQLPVLRLLLPLGLSYFTLQKLSYVIDVY